MSDRLLRVTAVAGGRRSDLAVPGGVAVADLVPDLARAVGLLDPAAAYAGYRLHAHGRRLRPDQGLREQGVADGALLAVTAGADIALPAVHDDLSVATAEVVDRLPRWGAADTRRTTLAAGLAALALAGTALGGVPVPGAAAAVALVIIVLAGHALPALAVVCGVGRTADVPVDTDRVRALVERSTRLLLVSSILTGATAVLLAPVVVDALAGAILTADCALVLLLRARRHRARRQVLVDAVGGLTVLLGTVLAAYACLDQLLVAAGTGAGGALLCVLARLPAPPLALRARLLDLAETASLVALAPLLLLVTRG
jgi:hypothetical protein